MDRLLIQGGKPLSGAVELSGSKNASLAILAGALLVPGISKIHNVPHIDDVYTMLEVLRSLGAEVQFDDDGTVTVDAQFLATHVAPYEFVKQMRASFYVAGPLLARLQRADVPLPGGCIIGSRPVNFHIDAFQKMGAAIRIENGYMQATCPRLSGARIRLDARWSSVGTTINVIMAAALADGETAIVNAARDPEVVDFARFLQAAGAEVEGAGTDTIRVRGVDSLHPCEHHVITDRIEAGTFLLAGAITGGDVTVRGASTAHLEEVLIKLAEAGLEVSEGEDGIRAKCSTRPSHVDVVTQPFPGFPTDLQPPFVAFLSLAEGRSLVTEEIYEARFAYVDELRRMGADITLKDRRLAVIEGVDELHGAPMEAPDIRAGAALVLAGLAATGETEVGGLECVDRGYENLEAKLRKLGASVMRVNEQGAAEVAVV